MSGYGSKHTTEECPEAIFIMCLQSIVGVMIQAFMVGVVFAKLSRPKKRTQTLLFSRNAVICQRDGILCLMFRVGDMRKSHIIEAHVRAQLIKKKVSISSRYRYSNNWIYMATMGNNRRLPVDKCSFWVTKTRSLESFLSYSIPTITHCGVTRYSCGRFIGGNSVIFLRSTL